PIRPQVTVVITAVDEGPVLAEKLACLARQDYPPECFEVVVACDGGEAATVALARAAAGRWLAGRGRGRGAPRAGQARRRAGGGGGGRGGAGLHRRAPAPLARRRAAAGRVLRRPRGGRRRRRPRARGEYADWRVLALRAVAARPGGRPWLDGGRVGRAVGDAA